MQQLVVFKMNHNYVLIMAILILCGFFNNPTTIRKTLGSCFFFKNKKFLAWSRGHSAFFEL
jgi:hypothetical protein